MVCVTSRGQSSGLEEKAPSLRARRKFDPGTDPRSFQAPDQLAPTPDGAHYQGPGFPRMHIVSQLVDRGQTLPLCTSRSSCWPATIPIGVPEASPQPWRLRGCAFQRKALRHLQPKALNTASGERPHPQVSRSASQQIRMERLAAASQVVNHPSPAESSTELSSEIRCSHHLHRRSSSQAFCSGRQIPVRRRSINGGQSFAPPKRKLQRMASCSRTGSTSARGHAVFPAQRRPQFLVVLPEIRLTLTLPRRISLWTRHRQSSCQWFC